MVFLLTQKRIKNNYPVAVLLPKLFRNPKGFVKNSPLQEGNYPIEIAPKFGDVGPRLKCYLTQKFCGFRRKSSRLVPARRRGAEETNTSSIKPGLMLASSRRLDSGYRDNHATFWRSPGCVMKKGYIASAL